MTFVCSDLNLHTFLEIQFYGMVFYGHLTHLDVVNVFVRFNDSYSLVHDYTQIMYFSLPLCYHVFMSRFPSTINASINCIISNTTYVCITFNFKKKEHLDLLL